MVVVADAAIAIRGDLSGYNRDLQRAEGSTKGFAGRIQNILSPRNVIGAAGLFGVGLGVHQLVGYAGSAADAYAQLEQTVKTVDQVFGDSAGVIKKWGETAAETAGMSQREFMSSAAVMGQTLLNMGYGAEEAAEKTTQLLQVAGDLAIAFGKTPQDALLGITAAMRGERDTIEKFGVALKQVDVNARIAALGLDTSTAAAKKNAEAVAVVDLLLEQTADTAGRFAAEQDSVAAKMAEASARWDDFMTQEVGSAVASIQLGFFEVVDASAEATEGVGMFFDNIFNPEKQAIVQKMADEFGISFNDMRERIQQGANDAGRTWEDQLDHMVGVTSAASQELGNTGERMGKDLAIGLERAAPEVENASRYISTLPEAKMVEQYQAIRAAGYQSQVELAKGLIDAQNEVQVAIDAATQIMEEELTANEEIMYLKGEIQTMETARGIASEEGKQATVIAMDAAIQAALDRIEFLQSDFYQSGHNVGVAWANGLRSSADWAALMAWEVAAAANPALHGRSPPVEGPLKDIDKGGYNVGVAWAEGLASAADTARAASWSLAGSLSPSMGSGALMSSAGLVGSGSQNNYYLNVNGVPHQVSSPEEMVDKLIELGVMTEGRLS